ncbi:MAG: hypothetical protein GXP45_03105 [bacterium]|nr:hypothetical protein [bacterium]
MIFAYDQNQDFYFSSDKQALAGYADKFIYLKDADIVHIKDKDYKIISNGIKISRKIEDMDINSLEASK